jgi:hypothetical protein
MKTRTLLLMALACGVAILVAGVIQLVRVDRQRPDPALAMGESATVGDLDVTVLSSLETATTIEVQVLLSGVSDDAVEDSFALVVPGDVLAPTGGGDEACGAVDIDAVECTLTFDLAGLEGSARTLVVRRGEAQRRWVVATG